MNQEVITNERLPQRSEEEDLNERVVLNVGGNRFEVTTATLVRYPQTLLGEMFLPQNSHLRRPDKRGEYFFDRNPRLFEFILDFYRTGKLIPPKDVPADKVRDELKFYGIRLRDDDDDEETEPAADPDALVRAQPAAAIFDTAFELVRQRPSSDIRRGLMFLHELLQKEEHQNNVDFMFVAAFGYHRLGNSAEAKKHLDTLLTLDPGSQRGLILQTLIADKQASTVRMGFIFWTALAVGGLIWYRSRK
eukprot:TRINITY_DN30918_c0_g1_i1.p1 TRINITY_DN30918_c0_g1~~TRINITY_DN30918_c0_g1_i1.p1  ORF type:complete len:248 (-),score=28.36 TRINITY_DN30918_c0_g1_i1:243-986(-)